MNNNNNKCNELINNIIATFKISCSFQIKIKFAFTFHFKGTMIRILSEEHPMMHFKVNIPVATLTQRFSDCLRQLCHLRYPRLFNRLLPGGYTAMGSC